jgi:hypothetical protein
MEAILFFSSALKKLLRDAFFYKLPSVQPATR